MTVPLSFIFTRANITPIKIYRGFCVMDDSYFADGNAPAAVAQKPATVHSDTVNLSFAEFAKTLKGTRNEVWTTLLKKTYLRSIFTNTVWKQKLSDLKKT